MENDNKTEAFTHTFTRWIHKGNKPEGTNTSSDLQLQLGSKDRWVNFSTLCLAY